MANQIFECKENPFPNSNNRFMNDSITALQSEIDSNKEAIHHLKKDLYKQDSKSDYLPSRHQEYNKQDSNNDYYNKDIPNDNNLLLAKSIKESLKKELLNTYSGTENGNSINFPNGYKELLTSYSILKYQYDSLSSKGFRHSGFDIEKFTKRSLKNELDADKYYELALKQQEDNITLKNNFNIVLSELLLFITSKNKDSHLLKSSATALDINVHPLLNAIQSLRKPQLVTPLYDIKLLKDIEEISLSTFDRKSHMCKICRFKINISRHRFRVFSYTVIAAIHFRRCKRYTSEYSSSSILLKLKRHSVDFPHLNHINVHSHFLHMKLNQIITLLSSFSSKNEDSIDSIKKRIAYLLNEHISTDKGYRSFSSSSNSKKSHFNDTQLNINNDDFHFNQQLNSKKSHFNDTQLNIDNDDFHFKKQLESCLSNAIDHNKILHSLASPSERSQFLRGYTA